MRGTAVRFLGPIIDLERHVEDSNARTALDGLMLKLRAVKVIGSYPRA